MTEKIPIGILISGRGSNMLALLKACQEKDYPCKPVVVISNRPDAAGLKIAEKAGVSTHVVDHKKFPNRESFEEQLNNKLKNAGAHILCNAGFMRILTEQFTQQWHNRHLNIHPSLLPRFPGTHVHEKVLQSGDKITGCTVHYVRAAVDSGPRIGQLVTSVHPNDSPETLAERVLQLEHELYPRVLRQVAEGRDQIIVDSFPVIEQCMTFFDFKNTVTTLAEETLQPKNKLYPQVLRQGAKRRTKAVLDSICVIDRCAALSLSSKNMVANSTKKIFQPGNKLYPNIPWRIAEGNKKAVLGLVPVSDRHALFSHGSQNMVANSTEKIFQPENKLSPNIPWRIAEGSVKTDLDLLPALNRHAILSHGPQNIVANSTKKIFQPRSELSSNIPWRITEGSRKADLDLIPVFGQRAGLPFETLKIMLRTQQKKHFNKSNSICTL